MLRRGGLNLLRVKTNDAVDWKGIPCNEMI